MHDLAQRVLTTSRRKWLGTRPLFEPFKPVDSAEISRIESKVGSALPQDMAAWLLCVGYGDVDRVLSFRYDWFHTIEEGQLIGSVIFAQDDLGNFYAYSPSVETVFFFARSSPEYAILAPSFSAFMGELERLDFNLGKLVDGVTLLVYDRDA